MKITAKDLNEVCKKFGFEEVHTQELTKEFLAEYSGVELAEVKCGPDVSYYSESGKEVLRFKAANHVAWNKKMLSATAVFRGKDFEHAFDNFATDVIYWPNKDLYQYTDDTTGHKYTEKGIGRYPNGTKTYTQIQYKGKTVATHYGDNGNIQNAVIHDKEKCAIVRYDSKGNLESIALFSKKGTVIKHGLPAKVSACLRKIPLRDIYEHFM